MSSGLASLAALAALASLAPMAAQPAWADPEPQATPVAEDELAGYIFGVPVPLSNYLFAKRVSYTFPRPWEEGRSAADRERLIWEALILHFESFRRGVSVSDEVLEQRINQVLQGQQQAFTRQGDPDAYAQWVRDTLGEDVAFFENQMRYLLQIDTLKDQMRESFSVSATEEELHEEFLNESHHVGGEMVVFDEWEAAQAFYEAHRDPAQWEAMKAARESPEVSQGAESRGPADHGQAPPIRPVSLMTLEAYRDLWSIPKEQLYAFHALDIGSVGPPMPFGKQWCVYRLLEKRTGDLKDFPPKRDAYVRQVTQRKQYRALKEWTEDLKRQADLTVLPAAGRFSWAADETAERPNGRESPAAARAADETAERPNGRESPAAARAAEASTSPP